eukprot:4817644-Prymnesium_polylepis.2
MGMPSSATTCAAETDELEQPAPMIATMPWPKAFLVRCSAPASVLDLRARKEVVGDAVALVVDLAQRLVDADSGRPGRLRGVVIRRSAKHGQQNAHTHHWDEGSSWRRWRREIALHLNRDFERVARSSHVKRTVVCNAGNAHRQTEYRWSFGTLPP